MDLGGVVLGINFRRVFQRWAESAGVDEAVFYEHWKLDDAYKAQEIGELDFTEYTAHLGSTLNVSMSQDQWRDGWNALWTEPHRGVAALFPALKQSYRLCAFSNTNAVHADSFLRLYPEVLGQFDQLYLSHEVACRKPHVSSFHHVCDLMRVQPEQVTFLDDSPENVRGAETAGLTAMLTRNEPEVVAVLQSLHAHSHQLSSPPES